MLKTPRKQTVSIIVPAYNQEKIIIKDIKNLNNALLTLNINYEIIVVVDGFGDKTFEQIKTLKIKNLKVLGYKENKGKGFAVKHGVLSAKGTIIGFIDAGMDLDPMELSVALSLMEMHNADIVVGSKLHPDSKVNYPPARRVLSWGYRSFTQLLFGYKVKDTQVGLKLFKRKVARAVFSKIVIKRFAFDIEVLAVAHQLGYTNIIESPIKLNFNKVSSISSVNFWRVIFWMLWDTMAVFYRLKLLKYYDRI